MPTRLISKIGFDLFHLASYLLRSLSDTIKHEFPDKKKMSKRLLEPKKLENLYFCIKLESFLTRFIYSWKDGLKMTQTYLSNKNNFKIINCIVYQ